MIRHQSNNCLNLFIIRGLFVSIIVNWSYQIMLLLDDSCGLLFKCPFCLLSTKKKKKQVRVGLRFENNMSIFVFWLLTVFSTFRAYFEWQWVKDTMNIMSTHQCSWPVRIQDHPDKGSINKAPFSRGSEFLNVGYHAKKYGHSARKCRPIFASSVSNSMDPSDSDDTDKKKPQNGEMGGVRSILSFLLLDQFIFMSKWFSNWIIIY